MALKKDQEINDLKRHKQIFEQQINELDNMVQTQIQSQKEKSKQRQDEKQKLLAELESFKLCLTKKDQEIINIKQESMEKKM